MTSIFETVKANASDIPVIRSIACAIWPAVYKDLLSDEQISYMMDMMYADQVIEKELANGVEWYLLKYENKTVGYCSIYFIDKVCKLDKIYISEEFRRCGIGRQTIEFVQKTATLRGAEKLILNVNKYNTKAQAAYKKYGFKHLRDEVNDIGNGFVMDDFVLALDISHP